MTNAANGHDKSDGDSTMSNEQEPELNMITQYVKDISFESPNAPMALKDLREAPNIQIGINVEARKIEEEAIEVCLEFTADAKVDDKFLYKMEVQYAGLFVVKNLPEELLQPVLFIQCPTLIFPFLRHVIVRLSQDGGFPPLQLDPIDFEGLYKENMHKLKKQGEEKAPVN